MLEDAEEAGEALVAEELEVAVALLVNGVGELVRVVAHVLPVSAASAHYHEDYICSLASVEY